jgi:hypothetical protein
MRRYYYTLFLFILSVFLVQCQKELKTVGSADPIPQTPLPITSNIQGIVTKENNTPAAGVTVTAGSKTAITDSKGYFRIMDASLDKMSSRVTAELGGYFKAFRTFAATDGTNHVEIKLTRRISAGSIDAITGGEVSLMNGAKVQLPPGGVVVASSGLSYNGSVTVFAAYIDPTSPDIDLTVPGSFMANDNNNNRVLLTSYGMMAVELSSPTGEKLQVKPGVVSKLTMPIPASMLASAPSSIPLWYVDEQTGIWKEEGSATRTGSLYTGEVKHYTYWNCDIPNATIPLSFTLKNPDGNPLPYAKVRIVRANMTTGGSVHGITDSLGQGNPLVPANQLLIFNVYDPCGAIIYSQNIGPFTQATNLGVITVTTTTLSHVTVGGYLLTCAGTPVVNGYVVVYYNGVPRYRSVNSNGQFMISFIKCAGSNEAHIFGVDATNSQQGQTQTVMLTSPLTNVGNITACGSSLQEYIHYKIDSSNFTITNLFPDSLRGVTGQVAGTTNFQTQLKGYVVNNTTNTGRNISFKFNSPGIAPGIFPLTALTLNNYGTVALSQNIQVNVTSFPQSVGLMYEGGFTGNFQDSQGVNHSIICTFKLKRRE